MEMVNGQKRMPGDSGFWVLIGGDMFAFTVFFLTFCYYRMVSEPVFYDGSELVTLQLGAINTVILLTSSLIVAAGVHRFREGRKDRAATLLTIGALCGITFLVNKAFEWKHLFSEGVSFETSDYFIYFFMFTGIHGVHVLLGLIVLLYMSSRIRNSSESEVRVEGVESAGIFWHLVDLLWVVLFALLYLLK